MQQIRIPFLEKKKKGGGGGEKRKKKKALYLGSILHEKIFCLGMTVKGILSYIVIFSMCGSLFFSGTNMCNKGRG